MHIVYIRDVKEVKKEAGRHNCCASHSLIDMLSTKKKKLTNVSIHEATFLLVNNCSKHTLCDLVAFQKV